MKSPKFDREKIEGGLLERLIALRKGKPDPIPEGHKTREQWAAEWGLKRVQAQVLIRSGLKNKVLGKAMHRIQVGKVLRPTEHYFEITPKKRARSSAPNNSKPRSR